MITAKADPSVAILGLGLMGGSLGLALKARGYRGRISGFARREEVREAAVRRRAVDAVYDDPIRAVTGAGLVVLCTPVLSIPPLVRACRPGLGRGCILTDVGSTKADLTAQVRAELRGAPARFIGSHPIAGSEQAGLGWARADLYEGAMTIVTPDSDSRPRDTAAVRRLWERVGAVVCELPARKHDRIMAGVSHLPHLVSAVLAGTVGRRGNLEETGRFCGSGFRDTTRIAEGSPEVWRDIALSNRRTIAAELKAFALSLARLARLVERKDAKGIFAFLANGKAKRLALLSASKTGRIGPTDDN